MLKDEKTLTGQSYSMTRRTINEFVSLSQGLASSRELRQVQSFEFTFKTVEKQFKSYAGINVRLS